MTHDSTGQTATDTPTVRAGVRALHCAADGPALRTTQDALDVIADSWQHDTDLVILPVERLDSAFFDLSSGVAGDILAKFAAYRVRLAVVGDISASLAASSALRAFVHESNRGRQCWFVPDLTELDARLTS